MKTLGFVYLCRPYFIVAALNDLVIFIIHTIIQTIYLVKGRRGGEPTTMVVAEEKKRRRVKVAGLQVISPEMFQRRVAGPWSCD